MPPPLQLGLGLSLPRCGGVSAFSPLDLNPIAYFETDQPDSLLNNALSVASATEGVRNWLDLTGNGNTLFQNTTGAQPILEAATGPASGPALYFDAGGSNPALTVTNLSTTATNPWVMLVWKPEADAIAAVVDSQTTDRASFYRIGADICRMSSPTNVSNLPATTGDWHVTIMNFGADGVYSNDGARDILVDTGATGEFDTLWVGRSKDYIQDWNGRLAAFAIGTGDLTAAQRKQIRDFYAAKYGFALPWESSLSDTFTRADTTPGASLGIGESRHEWVTTGNGTGKEQILGGTLTHAPTGVGSNTVYMAPQMNFNVTQFGWSYSERDLGGADNGSAAVLLTKLEDDLSDMIHFVWARTGWRLERYTLPGPVNTTVAERTLTSPLASGTYSVALNLGAGTITVTDPDGVVTVGDWEGDTSTDLSDYSTPFLQYELLCGADPGNVLQYELVHAS